VKVNILSVASLDCRILGQLAVADNVISGDVLCMSSVFLKHICKNIKSLCYIT